MRNLTAKQKRLLKQWYEEDCVEKVEDISWERWTLLESINDTEILYQNVNAYLWDLG